MPIGSLQQWGEPVRVGIACHRRADAVFHDLPVFLDGSRALTRDLLDRGVPRGAARAVGHAGWELLLDGALVADADLVDAYLRAMQVPVGDPSWRAALARRAARGAPVLYGDPAAVAELLRRILSARPRLGFGIEHRAHVVAALAAAQPAVAAAAADVVAAVTPTGG